VKEKKIIGPQDKLQRPEKSFKKKITLFLSFFYSLELAKYLSMQKEKTRELILSEVFKMLFSY
jgi:hypothetical protein